VGAFDAQITVMGRGQAPVITGTVKPDALGATLTAHIQASGVKSNRRIVVFAFESNDANGNADSSKVGLYYSKIGPDADGRVDMQLLVDVPDTSLQQYPFLFVTAVLGEDQRDCDGTLIEGTGPSLPDDTACLTLQRPGAPSTAAPSSAVQPLSRPVFVTVSAIEPQTHTGVSLSKGDAFVVRATGRVQYQPNGPMVGPDGAPNLKPESECVLAGGTHHAALIGRISPKSQPFLIGESYQGIAQAPGELLLEINDRGLPGNMGNFKVSIQVQKAS
jgi:hypothetical protein